MPRHARQVYPDVPMHVRQRGVDRMRCFHEESDYELFEGLLTELVRRESCRVHAYVLMPNHVHLLMTPGQSWSAWKFMRSLCQRYAAWFNRKYGRTGPLWESRYRSSLVDSERYLMECYRYVDLNPVRAQMVAHPGLFRWSSYASNALGAPSLIVQPHAQYEALGSMQAERRAAYAAWVQSAPDLNMLESIRAAIDANSALGSDDFLRRIEAQTGRKARPAARGRPGTGHRASRGVPVAA